MGKCTEMPSTATVKNQNSCASYEYSDGANFQQNYVLFHVSRTLNQINFQTITCMSGGKLVNLLSASSSHVKMQIKENIRIYLRYLVFNFLYYNI
jgi:hypothetical protein